MALAPRQALKDAFGYGEERTGYSVVSGATEASEWVGKLKRFSNWLGVNAKTYFSVTKRSYRKNRKTCKLRKMLNTFGFPKDISIAYVAPSPFALEKYSVEREIKHIALHSFGHMWTVNWMRNHGIIPVTYNNQTVYIPKGSDLITYHHPIRFAGGGIRTWTNLFDQGNVDDQGIPIRTRKAGTPHFAIARNGDLVILADCNDKVFCTNLIDATSIAIELEEALYMEEPPTKKNKPEWKGNTGSLKCFPFSQKQLVTLAVLLRKLEVAFGIPRVVLEGRGRLNTESPSGYMMHLWAEGGHHIDITPHFLSGSSESWTSEVFDLMTELEEHIYDSAMHVWMDSVSSFELEDNFFEITETLGDIPYAQVLEKVAKDKVEAIKRAQANVNDTVLARSNRAFKQAHSKAETHRMRASIIEQNIRGIVDAEDNLPEDNDNYLGVDYL